MKIRWLRITGIGPFTGTHTVDFSAFEDSGLFLLDGPTGAGKSTLIDAITFALYGDVARTKDASKDRLRSNHISDSDPSEADLVFEVATGIYRVTRTPAYTPVGKKSQRNSKSTLTRVVEDPDAPDGWRTVEPIASGPRDVGYEIPRIVGLDKDQFLQTAPAGQVLPVPQRHVGCSRTDPARHLRHADLRGLHEGPRRCGRLVDARHRGAARGCR